MKTNTPKPILVERPGALTDADRGSVIASLQQAATTSSLIKNSTVLPGLITQIAQAFAGIKPASDAIAADEAKLATDKTTLSTARAAFDRGYNLVMDVAEHDATSAQDLTAMNLTPLVVAPRSLVLVAPAIIDVRTPKKATGYVTASVHETGKTRHRYVAEQSPDPFGPTTWVLLAGTGKARRVTGASGAKVWVRFALVRGEQQSDWSTPIVVVIP